MALNRRTVLVAGVGAAALTATTATAPSAMADDQSGQPNPVVPGEADAVCRLRRALNEAAVGAGRFELDDAGRRIVVAEPITYLLKRHLVIGPDTTLRAHGASFTSDYPLVDQEFKADRANWHSPTPTYADSFTSKAVDTSVEPTLLLNHVPSEATGRYAAPGNIRVEGGTWDPTAHYLRDATGDDLLRGTAAPAMNGLTFQHTHDIEVVGVTVRNVKWWHAIEFNAVSTATLRDSRLEGYIENPTTGLWNGDGVQFDQPQPNNVWVGAPDRTPSCDIRVIDNHCGRSDTHRGWAKFAGSHSWSDGHPYTDIWIERNTITDTLWDAILVMTTSRITVRENTIRECRGGIYAKTAGPTPLQTIDIIGNEVSLLPDTGRPVIGVVGASATTNISDVAVYGNRVSGGSFWYSWAAFRREPQRS